MTSLSTAELRLQSWLNPLGCDTAVAILLQFMRTSARDWLKAELLAAAPTMGLSSRKLKQAFGIAKESKHIEHRADGTALLF
jgi:hypothetical protein